MILVVDANILFSALIKPGTTRAILLLSGYEFYTPEFTIKEFNNHLPELQEKTGSATQEINKLFEAIITTAEIKLVPFEEFKNKKQHAEKISPDKADVAYMALALHLNCPLWSNDKALKKQSTVKVFSTTELLKETNQ